MGLLAGDAGTLRASHPYVEAMVPAGTGCGAGWHSCRRSPLAFGPR